MLSHYFSTALRNFLRFRVAVLVNVMCLSLGLACFVLTYLVVEYLRTSDRDFTNLERIRVIAANLDAPAGGMKFDAFPQTGPVLASFLETDFPELEAVARRTPEVQEAVAADNTSVYARISYADPKLTQMFDFSYQAGSGATALRAPKSAVITEKAANQIFRTTQVIGKTVRIANREDVTITAVIADVRPPTTFRFDLLVSMDVLDSMRRARGIPEPTAGNFANWWWLQGAYITYVLLPADGRLTVAGLEGQLEGFATRNVPVHQGGNTLGFTAVPVGSVPLNVINGQLAAFAKADVSFVVLGYTLASMVLLIACINYANLAASLAAERRKEVGLRKVVGASRSRVLVQHLFEAGLVALLSLVVVLVLVLSLAPMVQRIGFDIEPGILLQSSFLPFLLLLLASVVVTGGVYPAVILSAIRPVEALRSGPVITPRRFMPSALVFLQFGMSGFLLITVIVMHSQNRMMLDPGRYLRKDPIVVLTSRLETAQVDLELLRGRLATSPLIKSVSATLARPMSLTAEPMVISPSSEQAVRPSTASIVNVSYDFLQTMEMQLLAGRDFDRARGDDMGGRGFDLEKPKHILVDSLFVERMGWSIAEAPEKTVFLRYGEIAFPMEIIGVVSSRPLHLLGLGATGSMYFLVPRPNFVSIRISGNDVAGALDHIDRTWKELSPNVPLQREFLDDLMEQTYQTLLVLSKLFTAMATFGLVIAGMGLFGMAIYMADRRIREIGIRKTMGATTGQVLGLLLRDFSRPVVVASILAWPLAFVVARIYLNMFVERTTLSLFPFVVGLLVTLLVAWLAVGKRALRAAQVTPASVLRYE